MTYIANLETGERTDLAVLLTTAALTVALYAMLWLAAPAGATVLLPVSSDQSPRAAVVISPTH
jgi:hypothetical protein